MSNTYFCVAYGGATVTCPPGHTMAALRKAIEIGATCNYVEVRTTRDGELVAWYSMQRIVGDDPIYLTDHTLAEWRNITEDDPTPIVSLDDVLTLTAQTGYALFIDVRAQGVENALARKLRKFQISYDSLMVVTSSDSSRTVMRSMDPKIRVAHRFGMDHHAKITGDLLMSIDADAVVWPGPAITPEIARTLKDRGLAVYGGPVVLGDEMRRLRNKCGVDGIVTPCPELLLSLFSKDIPQPLAAV